MKILPEEQPDGIWLTVYVGDAASDTVGPLVSGRSLSVEIQGHVAEAPKGVHRSIRERSRKAELRVAADIGGRAQPGSGSSPLAKGDVRLKGKTRVEHKTTTTGSYRITVDLLEKIRSHCGPGETPSFIVQFTDKAGREIDQWVMIPYEVWCAHYKHK